MTAVVVTDAAQGSQEWMQKRREGVGGSDIATLCGLNPWATEADLWLEKRGMGDDSNPSEPMLWGHRLEPVVRAHYQQQRSRTFVEEVPGILAHPDYPVTRASIDGLIHDPTGTWLLEVKTTGAGFDELPVHYAAQVQWYLGVTGLAVADVAVLARGQRYSEFRVEASPEWFGSAVALAERWWQRHIVDGAVPDLDAARDAAKLPRLFDADPTVAAVTLTDEAVARLRQTRARLAQARADAAEAEAAVKIAMGPATAAVDEYGFPVASWTATKPRASVDVDALRGDGLYDKYTRLGQPSRRFTVNNNEGDRG